MLIGSQYSDNKLYRGIKFYDSMPLVSEDLHEYEDMSSMKNAYIMNNIIGYGVLNTPKIQLSSTSIRLLEPAVVLIDGDVSLVQTDENLPLITRDTLVEYGITSGVICIVGWYQAIDASSTLRNYGGVDNSSLPNDIVNKKFGVQISSRYQFRWEVTLVRDIPTLQYLTKPRRDAAGNILADETLLEVIDTVGDVCIAEKPEDMPYAISDIFIVPLLKYSLSEDNQISSVSNYLPVTPKGTSGFIDSIEMPTGEYTSGTVWYNHLTGEFRTYVAGRGFVENTSKMGYLQYQSVYTVPVNVSTPQDIVIPISIEELGEGDIIRVIYEGLTLIPGEQYTIDFENHSATLKDFTLLKDEKITFTAVKIVEANDISNITQLFTKHMDQSANDILSSHVKLTDYLDPNYDTSKGVAATPKLVYNAVDNALDVTFDALNSYVAELREDIAGLTHWKNNKGNTLVVTNGRTNISPSEYKSDSTYPEYPFRAAISPFFFTYPGYDPEKVDMQHMIPTVTYSVKDALSGIHCPVASTDNEYVYLYASEIPESDVVVESIVVQGEDMTVSYLI